MDRNETLLSIGGEKVVSSRLELSGKDRLLENRNVVVRKMVQSACHYNCAKLVLDHRKSDYDGCLQMWTGWALSDDGIWREHSWLVAEENTHLFPIQNRNHNYGKKEVESGSIIETTEKRTQYFGHPVSKEEFQRISGMVGAM